LSSDFSKHQQNLPKFPDKEIRHFGRAAPFIKKSSYHEMFQLSRVGYIKQLNSIQLTAIVAQQARTTISNVR